MKQSPLNINTKDTVEKNYPPFYIRGHDNYIYDGKITNNGHTG